MEQILWVEKYRPHTIHDCILPETLKETFQEYVHRKEIPNLLLVGSAGVGKTTVAKALCEEIGCDYIVLNGSDEGRLIETFRTKIKNYASSMSLMGGRKVIIIDEADYSNAESVQPALRSFMEEFAKNCAFIFTCNFKNKIIEPLHSRCAVVDFKIPGAQMPKMAAQFMKRLSWILEQEKVQYDETALAAVITKYFPDNRRILNELQRLSLKGEIKDLGQINQLTEIDELLSAMKDKKIQAARKWIVNHLDNEPTELIRKIYDKLQTKVTPDSIPAAIQILAKYQYQAAFVADQEINLMSCVCELILECQFI